MSSLSDLDSTLDEAVRSYRVVKRIRTLKPASDVNRTVENLAQDHLDKYILVDPFNRIRLAGKTAGEILEDFLQGLGYERGSDLWFSLAHIVTERGERDDEII